MYAVGKVGTFFAQSVYTVSGPFHPFGGAVDIIVVQQEDGTFKSSPWYVKFGKFQGVLKRREKKVVVAVNDGDANFHMYLDHKGEAYFLKDAQGEGEVATFSPPEAASSGDENSSHMLALEYRRVEEGANPRAEQLGKEESEDEKGDDLELMFEGRDASKQLIQQSVEERAVAAAGLEGEEITGAQGNYSGGDLEIREIQRAEEGASSNQEHAGTQPKAEEVGHKTESSNAKVMHELLNKAVGLEATVKSTPASALLANAALTAVLKSAALDTDNISPKEASIKASTKVRRTASSNGMIVHGLLNQAIGLPPSHKSGPASRLIASAALASLKKAVSESLLDSSSDTPQSHVELVELPEPEGDLDLEKNHLDTIPGSPVAELKEEVSVVDSSTSYPDGARSLTSNGNTSDGMPIMKTVSSLGSISESEVDQPDVEVSDTIPPSRTIEFLDVMKTLEVRKLEILDQTLVVEVQEHVEKETLGPIGTEEEKDISDAEGRVESIVIDRKQVMERVHDLQGSSGPVGKISRKDAQALESAYEHAIIPEEVGKLVSVHVDKGLVENLQDALTQNIDGGLKGTLGKEKDITTPGKEVAILNSGNAQDVGSFEITTPGQELPIDSSREVPSKISDDVRDTLDMSTPVKELALQNQMNISDVSSPRQKAAIELEMAWREVMEKAAITLKGAPYTSKRLNHSLSYKKKGLESGQKKSDSQGRLPEQSEKKSWGGWWWGGSSAPQAKRTSEEGSSKDGKDVQGELGMEQGDLDFGSTELRDPSGVTSELEGVSKSGTHLRQDVEGSDSNVEAEEKGAQSESDSGPPEGTKVGTDQWVARGKPEDFSEFVADNKVQQKGPGEAPPRRRSLFGLLSRTNTNQSSLSSASSLRSNEDLEPIVFDGLKRNSSLERAENVVDLLEEKWARGSEARRARVEGSNSARASFKQADGNGSLLANAEPERGSRSDDGSNHSHDSSSILETTGAAETAVAQSLGTQDGENLIFAIPKGCQGTTVKVREAEDDAAGNEQGIEVTTNGSGDVETNSTLVVPDSSSSDLPSFSDVDVLLMSVDGHLVRAPLGLGNDEAAPLFAGDSAKMKRAGPQKHVCIADEPEDRPSLSPDTHNLARNGLEQQLSHASLGESDRHVVPHDSIEGKTANPGCQGLKELAKLIEDDDSVGAGQQKMGGTSYSHDAKGLATESAPDQSGPRSEIGEAPRVNGHDESHIEETDDKEFDDMRAMVFERLEEADDAEALVIEEGQIERFHSSKDLTEAEEEEERRESKFKPNLSVYMDAISGEDDQDSAGSAHEEDGLDRSRGNKSGPIGIPRAMDSGRNFPSEKDMHILRSASESLPNERHIRVDSEMVSPRLTLSRSLDSAPPSVLSPVIREQQSASSSDGLVIAAWPSTRSPVKGLEKVVVEAFAAERTPEKVKEDSEQQRGEIFKPDTQRSTAASSSSSMDNGRNGPETGLELSLCRHLLKERMGLEAAAQAFNSEKLTLDEFKKSGSAIAANDKLVVRVGGRYYPWVVAAPIVLGILAFGQVLIAPNEGAIAVEQPIVVFEGKPATSTSTAISGGGWKLWPKIWSQRPKTPERALVSREAMMVATEAALKSSVTQEYLRMAGYYMRPRKVRTNSPSSQQLASLNLKEGSNKITFTFETRVWGKQQVDARIYLWKWNARIVISDVDGTITKSDVLGQVMPLMGKDWTQIGVARLFSAIKKNGYELMFLSARAISQAYLTRQFLENIKQDGEALPDGPVVISPDGLFPSLYREVIRRAPHEFKIACLEDIKSLFPPESKPFYAGFGNRDTDELSYLKVGISKGKIFIINPKGEVVVNNQVDVKSYTSLHKLVDDMFPAMSFTEQEDYNEWNFWKLPLPDILDEPSVKSLGSSSSTKSVKSGRRS